MKKSIVQQITMLIIYSFFGIGLGGIVAMILSLNKIVPDTAMTLVYIVLPIAIVFVGFKIKTRFIRITFKSDCIDVKEPFKSSVSYELVRIECATGIKYYRMYGANMSTMFILRIKDHVTNKKKTYKTVLYDEKEIKKLIIS